ncbi:MAG: DUF3307 domain-containing protein [Anaerosomatales bacterium]|nr:DUF3307 domain-containing protein [Anaerosomatales bacterium]
MALFLRLLLGHVLGDFAFQPGRLVRAKRSGLAGQVLHASIVTACTAAVLADALPVAWPAVALAGAAHLAIEYLSVPARKNGGRSGLVVFVLDQALHILSLVLISLGLSAPVAPAIAWMRMSVVQLGLVDGIAIVSLMGAILAFEVRASALGNGEQPENSLLAFDGARVYGMIERAAALYAAAATPVPIVGYAAFVPRLAFALAHPPAVRARHVSEALVGTLLCTGTWLLLAALASRY